MPRWTPPPFSKMRRAARSQRIRTTATAHRWAAPCTFQSYMTVETGPFSSTVGKATSGGALGNSRHSSDPGGAKWRFLGSSGAGSAVSNLRSADHAGREQRALYSQPFSGDIIPANRIDPAAKAIEAFYAAPNTAGTAAGANNYTRNAKDVFAYDVQVARVDHNFS
jgi:hypothetical protein